MRIAQLASIWSPISSKKHEGIEAFVHLLTEALVQKGHDVTLFATGNSETHAELCSIYDSEPCIQTGFIYPDLIHTATAYQRADEFDIIHDHSGIIGPVIGSMIKTPILHTIHGPATDNAKSLYKLLNHYIYLTAISEYQKTCFNDLNFIDIIYDAIDTDAYPLSKDKKDYLLFVGRMNPQKGAHIAVEVANRLDKELLLVTKKAEGHEIEYYSKLVEPNINGHCKIIEDASIKEEVYIYSNAKCALFPIQEPEPFELPMIKSMSTGTPVVTTNSGSASETIINGQTGYTVNNDINKICEAVRKIEIEIDEGKINPNRCRELTVKNFSIETMVKKYEHIYEKICNKEMVKSRGFDLPILERRKNKY